MSATADIWTGHRVRLRAAREDDWQVFFEHAADTEAARLGDMIRLPPSESEWRERMRKPPDEQTDRAWLVIEMLADGAVAGSINVHAADRRHRVFEYGIGVFRPFWRGGVASEAVALLLRFYFVELGYHRVPATVYAFNEASLAMHRKLGFVQEGVLRDNLLAGGHRHDEVVFGMLSSEFEQLAATLP